MYTIIPGLAALVCIFEGEEQKYVAIYFGPDPLPRQGAEADIQWETVEGRRLHPATLPVELVAAVNKHFGTVFSLPNDYQGRNPHDNPSPRARYMESLLPIHVGTETSPIP